MEQSQKQNKQFSMMNKTNRTELSEEPQQTVYSSLENMKQSIHYASSKQKQSRRCNKICCYFKNPPKISSILFVFTIFVSLAIVVYFYVTKVIIPQYQQIVQEYDFVLLNTTTGLCLDGSVGSYFISKSGDPNKILLHFEGGGWFFGTDFNQTLENCYQRSKTSLGSSKYWAFDKKVTEGALSRNHDNNFKDWKKVIFNYCDGSGHQGSRKYPIEYKDTLLYFRGHQITIEQLEDVQKRIGLYSKAAQVVVSGTSAGGLASVHWANYITQRVIKGKVWVVPDSGLFYDAKNVDTNSNLLKIYYRSLVNIVNQEIELPVPQCLAQYPDSKQNCMFFQNIYKHVKAPLFVIVAMYDWWSLENILGTRCLSGASLSGCSNQQFKVIEEYRLNVLSLLQSVKQKPKSGIWANSCVYHGYQYNSDYYNKRYRVPANSQYSISKSIEKWMFNSMVQNFHIDYQKWPSNVPCAY